MPLTEDQLAQVRTEIGTTDPPSDGTLDDVFDRVLTVQATVIEVLTQRLADFQAQPAQFAVPGEYSQSTAANITALEKQISRVRSGVLSGATSRQVQLMRSPVLGR